jgi:serine protease AprX
MTRLYTILLIFFLSLFSPSIMWAKTWLIYFRDKNHSPYSLDHPEAFLSQRALERRQRLAVALDVHDLPVTPSYVQALRDMGGEVLVTSKWLNLVIVVLPDSVTAGDLQALSFIGAVGDATGMRPGRGGESPFLGAETFRPAAPEKRGTKGTSLDYGASYNQIAMINGTGLHNRGFRGQGMVIAVLDAGFWEVDTLPAFDTLWAHHRILGTRDFVNPGGDVFASTIHQHGMMVLSTMGGNLSGAIVGTAPDASYYLIRTEDANAEYIMEEYFWVEGAEYADSLGADIINSSLGYTVFDNSVWSHTYADMNGHTCPSTLGAEAAATRGMVVCNSAGNSGNSPWMYVGAPADGDSVFSVGAVDAGGLYAAFSSRGPTADGRLKPNVVAQGQGAVIASPQGGIWNGNGTSFSSPIIAGMTACLWQAHPTFNNMTVIRAIQQSSSQYYNPDDYLGFGIPDYEKADSILTVLEQKGKTKNLLTRLYPNPFAYYFVLELNLALQQDLRADLIDVTGRVVFSGTVRAYPGISVLTIAGLGGLSGGIYMVRITGAEGTDTRKLIKK